MAVFRIEKTRDYTVMSNYHLRDMSLSLKAKGLLSLMLSLPEEWDYTMKGLARICKDGVDSISGGIRELFCHKFVPIWRFVKRNASCTHCPHGESSSWGASRMPPPAKQINPAPRLGARLLLAVPP